MPLKIIDYLCGEFLKDKDKEMKQLKLFSIALIVCAFCFAHVAAKDKIVPVPNHVTWKEGAFKLSPSTTISYDNIADGRMAAEYLQTMVKRLTGISPKIVKGGKGNIRLGNARHDGGGYYLTVEQKQIRVEGNDYNALINGIATLCQMIDGITVPCAQINDKPRFNWRGFHLDCSRHFFSKDEIKELISLMALYKLNRFHWHLTDDQGWRIEIKQYPLLTDRGAWRTYNNQDSICIAKAKEEDNRDLLLPAERLRVMDGDTLYGGYYTQDDVREVVAYARQCGIEVVPEIDMPGHMLAAINNYQGISCFEEVGWGKVFTSPLCPGKNKTLDFCRNVWSEVFTLFPYEYVHIGGDEVEKDNWKKCADCQQRIKDNGLKSEEELQSWFIHQMERYFNDNGKKMIGWDEIIEGGLSPTSTVMWWRNWVPDAISKATANGNDVIHTPGDPFYLSRLEESTHMRDIYEYNPLPEKLSDEQKKHVLGVQANLWAEGIPSRERMLYMYFPRVLAVSELAWSQPERMNYDNFHSRLNDQLSMLHMLNVPYRIPSLEGFYNVNAFTTRGELKVICKDPLATVRYTTDGTFPTSQSPLYTEPVAVSETTHFILRTFNPEGRPDEPVHADFIKQEYMPSLECPDAYSHGLKAEWHEFRGATCQQIGDAPLNETYLVGNVEIPKEVSGNIGLIITGYIKIPTDGIYTFALMSDDGSWLKIDGNMIVDNDREQSPHEMICQQALRKGFHALEVRYFDHNGGMLRLHVMDADGNIIDPASLYFSPVKP